MPRTFDLFFPEWKKIGVWSLKPVEGEKWYYWHNYATRATSSINNEDRTRPKLSQHDWIIICQPPFSLDIVAQWQIRGQTGSFLRQVHSISSKLHTSHPVNNTNNYPLLNGLRMGLLKGMLYKCCIWGSLVGSQSNLQILTSCSHLSHPDTRLSNIGIPCKW